MKKYITIFMAVFCLCALSAFSACKRTNSTDTEGGYTVTIAVDGNGSVSKTSVENVVKDTVVKIEGNKLFIGTTEIVATANENNAQYTYKFTGFTGNPEKIMRDITITANFTRTVNQYLISFETGDAAAVEPVWKDYGTSFSAFLKNNVSAPEHYHFDKWQIKTGNNEYADLDGTETVNENATLKAVFAPDTYIVTWKNGNTVIETDTVEYGAHLSYDGETPLKTDYVFDGWTVGETKIDISSYIVTGNTVISAAFIEDPSHIKVESFSTGSAGVASNFYNKPSTWAQCTTSVVSSIGGASDEINAEVHDQMLKLSVNAHSWGDEVFTSFAGVVSNAFDTTDYEYLFVKFYTDWNSNGNFAGKGIVFGAGNNRIIIGNSGWYNLKIAKEDWAHEQKFYITPYNDYTETALSFNVYFDEIYYSEDEGEEFTFFANENVVMVDTNVNVERQKLFPGFDGVSCKDAPNIITDGETVYIGWGVSALAVSDMAYDGQYIVSYDGGRTFSTPTNNSAISRQEGDVIYSIMLTAECYSKKYDVFFALGLEVKSYVNAVAPELESKLVYQLRDKNTLEPVGEPIYLPFPFESPYPVQHGQPIEYENGDFLISFDYNVNGKARVVTVRYSFDGENFAVAEAGTPLINDGLYRGYCEPSVAKYGDKYYMTIRSNENAYLAWSDDGLIFSEPVLWKFDDGSIIGSCNTQQAWICHENALFLVYTRNGANNDHVMRNRAPLFMAKFDEDKKCLIKATEIVLVPDRGASLASMIGSCRISANESYICVAENMQADAFYGQTNWQLVAARGADNSIWLIKVSSGEIIPEEGYTVKVVINKDGYGTVSETVVTGVLKYTAMSATGNKLVIGDVEITAMPAAADEHYSYEFTGFTGIRDSVTKNLTITANFKRTALLQYTVTFEMGDGAAISAVSIDYGTSLSDILNSVSVTPPEHHYLVKWQIKVAEEYVDLDGTEILTCNVTLKAEYEVYSTIIEEFSSGSAGVASNFYNKPSTWAQCTTSVVSSIGGASDEINAEVHDQMLKLSVNAHSWGDEVFTSFAGVVSNAFDTTDYEYLFVKFYTDWNSNGNFAGKGIVFGAGNNRIIIGNSGWYNLKIAKEDWAHEQKFYITPYNDYTETALSFNVYFDEIYYSEDQDSEFTFTAQETLNFGDTEVTVERQKLFSGFDGDSCKDAPNIVSDGENVLIAWGVLEITHVDSASYGQFVVSSDLGITFSEPTNCEPYSYQEGDTIHTFAGTGFFYSKKYNVAIEFGIDTRQIAGVSVLTGDRYIPMYRLRNVATGEFIGDPKYYPIPFDFARATTYGQPIEYENGDILMTFYYDVSTVEYNSSFVTVLYSFDGENFTVKKMGTPVFDDSHSHARGYDEPSLAKLGDKYYMTIRTDENAYLAWSDDGLTFSEPILWRFDDGSLIDSCNTQAHWIRHENALFLVYTRKGNNNHVMRNRAPLYMAKFDEENKCLIKSTEIILVPDRGACLASMIGVCEISENESYICVAENMQGDPMYGWGDWRLIAARGADNSIWLIKISSEPVEPEGGFTVKMVVNNGEYGSVNETIINNISIDTEINVAGNKLYIGETEIIATAAETDEDYSYEFIGFSGNTETVRRNLTITVIFGRKALTQYLVSFETGDGDDIEPIMVDYGTPVSEILKVGVVPPEHYHLVKWQKKVGEEYSDLDGSEILTENLTLKAVYAIDTHTVTWKNGANVLETDTVEYGGHISYDGETPENGNGVFDCWKVGGETIDLDSYTVTGDVEIVAAFVKESYFLVEGFSAGTAVSNNSFIDLYSTVVFNTEVVSAIAGASDEVNAQANGQMLKVSLSMHNWGDSIYTNFAGAITDAFANTEFDYVIVKIYVDYTAVSSWLWIQIGTTDNFEYPNSCGWLNIKITRAAWANESKFYINSRNADSAVISPKLYFDEIIGGFDDISVRTILEDFSGANIYSITEDLFVGLNTKADGISTVSISGSNGATMAVQITTYLHGACYVKTTFGGIVTNAFETTDADEITLKMYINYSATESWRWIQYQVGSTSQYIGSPQWVDFTITRADWEADGYFHILPRNADSQQITFTIYFDEIYYDKEVTNVNLLTKTGFTAEELAGTYVIHADETTTVLTAEQLAAYAPVSGEKIVLVINKAGFATNEYTIKVN